MLSFTEFSFNEFFSDVPRFIFSLLFAVCLLIFIKFAIFKKILKFDRFDSLTDFCTEFLKFEWFTDLFDI